MDDTHSLLWIFTLRDTNWEQASYQDLTEVGFMGEVFGSMRPFPMESCREIPVLSSVCD